MINAYWDSIFTTAAILAIASVGLQITIQSGQFSVFHGAMMGMGGYAAGYSAVKYDLPFIPGLALASVVGAAAGVLVSALLLRLAGLTMGIATLAIGEGMVIVANSFFPGEAAGLIGVPLETDFAGAMVVLVAVILIATRLRASSNYVAHVASGNDAVAATSVGIPSARVRLWGFGIGGAIAGLAGGLSVFRLGLIVPTDLGFTLEVQLLLFVIIGGRATIWGPVLGAFAITCGTEGLRQVNLDLDRFWILGALLVLIMLLRPEGVLLRRHLRFGGTQLSALQDTVRQVKSRLTRAST